MMKKFTIYLFLFLASVASIAQVPESFNYQAVIRNDAGELITNQNIGVEISILQGSETGSVLYSEQHLVKSTNSGVINMKIGEGEEPTSDFTSINWGANTYFLKIGIDKTGGTSYASIGVFQLVSVPYALYAKNVEDINKDVLYFTESDTLFAVKDHDGNIVFAVYPDGAKVYVNNTTKGKVGGFAVTGRNPTKAFAEEDFMVITADSTRVYIPESASGKGKVGGFAVTGRNPSKGDITGDYFNISGTNSANLDSINPSEPRMLWYPKSEAFLVGRVLIEDPDSVGLNSVAAGFESKAMGNYSQAMGYKSITRGDYSTAIGREARADSINSFAFGNHSLAIGEGSYAIGSGAVALGENSFALGSVGVDSLLNLKDSPKALGDYSFAMGLGTKSTNLGSISIGANNESTGGFATALGFTSTARGYGSTAIGYRCQTSENANLSFAGGVGSIANERGAISFGSYCEANGPNSVAIGERCVTDGTGSVAMGKGTKALASGAIALGLGSVADGVRSFALGAGAFTNGKEGAFVVNATDQSEDKVSVHAVRNGQVVFVANGGYNFYASSDTAEQNAFVIQPSTGNIGIGTFNPDPQNKLEINGGNLSMMGKTSINLIEGGDINIKDGDINLEGTAGIFVNGNPVTFSDYVFEDDYELETIEEHAEFMWREKHLPALKGVKDIEKEGGKVNILERREKILEELEKAHIYIEQLNNRIKELEAEKQENEELKQKVEKLEELVNQLVK